MNANVIKEIANTTKSLWDEMELKPYHEQVRALIAGKVFDYVIGRNQEREEEK